MTHRTMGRRSTTEPRPADLVILCQKHGYENTPQELNDVDSLHIGGGGGGGGGGVWDTRHRFVVHSPLKARWVVGSILLGEPVELVLVPAIALQLV